MRVIFFLENFQKKKKKKMKNAKILFVSEIIASENVVSIKKRTLVIGSQWVNK